MPIKIAMMAMTTKSSIRVMPRRTAYLLAFLFTEKVTRYGLYTSNPLQGEFLLAFLFTEKLTRYGGAVHPCKMSGSPITRR